MNYIVLDLEFNQPFPFKCGTKTVLNPECPFEIIQIGAVKLNQNFELVDTFNFMIKPKIYPRIHPFVEKITGLTEDKLKNCSSFPEAFQSFVSFIGPEKNVLCTWGVDDIKSLFKNILFYNLDINLLTDQYINVQTYATKYLKYESGKNIGLKNAVTELNLEISSAFHDAFNDADYTAKIFQVVRPNELVPDTFHVLDMTKKKQKSPRINVKSLFQHFESTLKRELTPQERTLIKSAYKLGRKQAYDITTEKKN